MANNYPPTTILTAPTEFLVNMGVEYYSQSGITTLNGGVLP